MGVGTNIQARAVRLVDMDAPWRPADVEQRHGRILRQGNPEPGDPAQPGDHRRLF